MTAAGRDHGHRLLFLATRPKHPHQITPIGLSLVKALDVCTLAAAGGARRRTRGSRWETWRSLPVGASRASVFAQQQQGCLKSTRL